MLIPTFQWTQVVLSFLIHLLHHSLSVTDLQYYCRPKTENFYYSFCCCHYTKRKILVVLYVAFNQMIQNDITYTPSSTSYPALEVDNERILNTFIFLIVNFPLQHVNILQSGLLTDMERGLERSNSHKTLKIYLGKNLSMEFKDN